MCPAVVIKNGVLARKFKDSSKLKFIMVSFDYIYDTPDNTRFILWKHNKGLS